MPIFKKINQAFESRLLSHGDTPEQRQRIKVALYASIIALSIGLIWILLLKPEDNAMAMKMGMGMDMSKMKHARNFGPGPGYHIHKQINPDDFERVADIAKKATDLPAPLNRTQAKTVEIKLTAKEVISDIAPVTPFHYWTFNNTVPGPFLRVRVGDTVKLSLHNDTSSSHDHSIDLHAVTGPGGGAGLTEVKPGKTKTIQFKPLNPGAFVYHCATPNAPTHITNGMYGMILVEPEQGLSKVDREFYVMQGELYTQGLMGDTGFQSFDGQKMVDEAPEYIVYNGRPFSLVEERSLKAKRDETVRLFVGNGGVAKIASFHVIGEIFDRVYPEASTSDPLANVQTTLIPAGGATVVEFTLEVPGNYVLVDHALTRIERGAWGVLSVEGEGQSGIYAQMPL